MIKDINCYLVSHFVDLSKELQLLKCWLWQIMSMDVILDLHCIMLILYMFENHILYQNTLTNTKTNPFQTAFTVIITTPLLNTTQKHGEVNRAKCHNVSNTKPQIKLVQLTYDGRASATMPTYTHSSP